MSIQDQIPGMTDKELAALKANCARLTEGADVTRRLQAEELMPAIEAELAARAAKKPAKKTAKKKAAPSA
jgi:hypothetical protein